jgi:elongation factor 1 alpha-like protein
VSDGQTKEHALLVRSLGVAQLIVAVNKLDTVDWAQSRFNEIVGVIGHFLKQIGFKGRLCLLLSTWRANDNC